MKEGCKNQDRKKKEHSSKFRKDVEALILMKAIQKETILIKKIF